MNINEIYDITQKSEENISNASIGSSLADYVKLCKALGMTAEECIKELFNNRDDKRTGRESI